MHNSATEMGQNDNPKQKIETFYKVYVTMRHWQETVMLHLEYHVQEISNKMAATEEVK